MVWWEYLIVVVVWFCVWGELGHLSGFDLTGREGQEFKKVNFVLIIVSACFLLLMLISYKLFIDPIW